jgi:hypothetical protein
MAQGETHDVTHLPVSWQERDRHALDKLIPEITYWPAVARLDVLALDKALTRLLQVSERTVHREWAVAKTWLYGVMRGGR